MTTTAHGARRIWGGATRSPVGRTGSRNDWYKELHPEMYKEIPSSRPSKMKPPSKRRGPKSSDKAIRDYLRQGDATASQIATALGLTYNAVYICLARGLDGIVIKGVCPSKKGTPSQLWGLQDIHTTGKTE